MKGIIMVLTDRYFKFISVILISLVLEGSTCDSHPKIYDFKTARMLAKISVGRLILFYFAVGTTDFS
ncbi:hypothetical protein SETIT_1G119100v2 [Setaria italica]|nr:hypothetical protein SETIT_1G119100v2 [Setaria italica]TKW38487.1 hypothetical protein SEVIR_1G113800v2 [Setaria viridis]